MTGLGRLIIRYPVDAFKGVAAIVIFTMILWQSSVLLDLAITQCYGNQFPIYCLLVAAGVTAAISFMFGLPYAVTVNSEYLGYEPNEHLKKWVVFISTCGAVFLVSLIVFFAF